VMRRTS